ncbi:bacteriocin immunity protein [Loigolactobacillus jiayinensis]|uniref:Bacteriocin immunity protein n=1 Tax=Loigolactobacillus jiayinensis TaxID=2486016 RepID=A0ABW1R803_9LACO|nr:bacteriocin immunity protein [Loigolactobacillus jiayinensis]
MWIERIERTSVLAQALRQQGGALNEGKDYNLICVKLSHEITNYLVTHKFQAPQSLLDLAKTAEHGAADYRGAMSASVWLKL